MAGLIYDLISILNDETDRYTDLLKLLIEKNEAIVKNNIEMLNGVTFKEQGMINAIQKLEKARILIVKDMAIVLNKKESQLNLKEIIRLLKGQTDEAIKLQEASDKLTDVLADVKYMNDQNAALIKNALDYIEYSMNVLQTSQSVEPPTYPNKNQSITSKRFFDTKS